MSVLNYPWFLAEELSRRWPASATSLPSCIDELGPFARLTLSSAGDRSSAVLVVNQAFNDFVDLCFDLLTCRGRSALRTSRAMFEHLVNLLDVESSPDAARRYIRHGSVAAQTEARAAYGVDRLAGSELKAARHALKKLARDSDEDYAAALSEYGSTFRSSWAGASLYDRAVATGLGEEYDFYRLAGAVLHGSAGGAKGTTSARYERPVHRTGPAWCFARWRTSKAFASFVSRSFSSSPGRARFGPRATRRARSRPGGLARISADGAQDGPTPVARGRANEHRFHTRG